MSVLRAEGLTWSRPTGESVLRDAALHVDAGEVVVLSGASGTGKTVLGTTLLRLRTLASPGRVHWGEVDVSTLGAAALTPLRAQYQGLLQHSGALLPSWLTVGEALTETAMHVGGDSDRAAELASRLGLGALLDRVPAGLSGGEQRRAALARVLLSRPRFAFIDEPDAGLDPLTAADVADLVREAADRDGVGVLLVTHDARLADRCASRGLRLRDGGLVDAA